VDAKQARSILVQLALWGFALSIIGGVIAGNTRPHVDRLGFYRGDETGFWFGVIVAWVGTMLLLVPVIACGVRLARAAWPAPAPTAVGESAAAPSRS
jgi:hypothetical protein